MYTDLYSFYKIKGIYKQILILISQKYHYFWWAYNIQVHKFYNKNNSVLKWKIFFFLSWLLYLDSVKDKKSPASIY